jgi:chemotaxis protein CheD
MNDDMIHVGMADYKLCNSPTQITTHGLGSCLGVVIYERTTGICGMAHVMLPDSSRISTDTNRKKFADTCLQDMYEDLLRRHVNKDRMAAKIAGGAKMFSYRSSNEFLNIGAQNYVAVCKKLAGFNIPILAEDVGDTCSRTIIFDPATEKLSVRVVRQMGIEEYII